MATGINTFLQGLAGQGSQESSGEFTLSADSLQKLSRYQLLDPSLYVLNVLSLAVLGEATYLDIKYSAKETRLRFDGRRFSREELETVGGSPDRSLQELFIALTALRALEPREIVFLSQGGYRFKQGSVTTFEDGAGTNELSVHRPRAGSSWLTRVLGASDRPAWETVLLQSVRYSVLKLVINGEEIKRPPLFVYFPTFHLGGPTPALPVCRPVGTEDGENAFRSEPGGNFTAILGCRPNEWAERWNIVLRGVNYDRPVGGIPLGGLGGVIVTNDLRKNLSQTDLVEDEAFQDLVRCLQESVLEMVRDGLTHAPLGREQLGAWDDVALWTGENLRERGLIGEAMRVEAWGLAHRNMHRRKVFTRSDNLADRYPDPLEFLNLYLQWWQGDSPLDQLERFVLALGAGVSGGSVLPVLVERANPEALRALFERLLPHFPHGLGWPDLSVLMQKLEPKVTVAPFKRHLMEVKDISNWQQREALCEAALFLHREKAHSFKEWLDGALNTGFLQYEQALIE